VELSDFISVLEEHLGKKAVKEYLPMQSGDVAETFADIDDLMADVGFKPSTPIEEGLKRFIGWYKNYYRI
jgi:UDP-glucuronate 4-epimerase